MGLQRESRGEEATGKVLRPQGEEAAAGNQSPAGGVGATAPSPSLSSDS